MYAYIASLLGLAPASAHPSPVGHHGAPSWAPCALQLPAAGYVFYTWECTYVSAALSVHPILSFPPCAHKSILYVCVGSYVL